MRSWTGSLLLIVLGVLGLSSTSCGRHESTATIIMTWSVVNASYPDPTMAPLRKCADVGVKTVRIDVGTGGLYDFPCENYAGETFSFPSGTYNIQAIAFSETGGVLNAKAFQNVYSYGQTKLGDVRFQIP